MVPPDLQCKDKFLVQSVVVSDGLSAKHITSQMVYDTFFLLIYGYQFGTEFVIWCLLLSL